MNDVESSTEGVHGSKQAFLFGCGVSDVKSLKLAVQLTVTLRCGHNQTLNQGHSRFVSWTSFCSITSSHCEQFKVFSRCWVFYFGPSSLPAVLCPTSCPPHMLSAAWCGFCQEIKRLGAILSDVEQRPASRTLVKHSTVDLLGLQSLSWVTASSSDCYPGIGTLCNQVGCIPRINRFDKVLEIKGKNNNFNTSFLKQCFWVKIILLFVWISSYRPNKQTSVKLAA